MKSTQKALELARFACEEPFCLIESKTVPMIHRLKLEILGWYIGKNGMFEFIKEPDNTINHRFFRVTE